MGIRILFIGENWHGSNAASCKRAFRALGCDVLNVDEWHFYPQWESLKLKVIRHALRRIIVNEFCNHLEKQFQRFHPHLVFIFKGSMVRRSTLQFFKQEDTMTFNFYPDVDLVKHHRIYGNDFLSSVQFYDCIFTPKSYHIKPLKAAGAQRVEFLSYAYDPWCHYPVFLGSDEKELFDSDLAFVGIWGKERAEKLEALVSENFSYSLAVWGNRWERLSPASPLRKFVQFKPAVGHIQARIFAGTKIALAFLSPPDLHTARTFEIPAFGAFMLAERTPDHTFFFEEGREIVCFRDVEELREKIAYYLAHDLERQAIAKAGYDKVTRGGHSYVDRMSRVLEVYREISG